jgi:hypothetical protein
VKADENLEQEPARILPGQYAGIPDPTRMA